MAIKFDFLLDDSGDLSLSDKGDLKLVTENLQSVKQRVGIRTRTNMGSWDFDTTYGIPYFDEIISQKISNQEVEAIFKTEVLREGDIEDITNLVSSRNNLTRDLELAFDVIAENDSLRFTLLDQPDDIIYPDSDPTNIQTTCSLSDAIQSANDLYELINYGLPEELYSTWIDSLGFKLVVNSSFVLD